MKQRIKKIVKKDLLQSLFYNYSLFKGAVTSEQQFSFVPQQQATPQQQPAGTPPFITQQQQQQQQNRFQSQVQ